MLGFNCSPKKLGAHHARAIKICKIVHFGRLETYFTRGQEIILNWGWIKNRFARLLDEHNIYSPCGGWMEGN